MSSICVNSELASPITYFHSQPNLLNALISTEIFRLNVFFPYLTCNDLCQFGTVNHGIQSMVTEFEKKAKSLDLSAKPDLQKGATDKILAKAIQRYPAITSLNLAGSFLLSAKALREALTANQGINELNLTRCKKISRWEQTTLGSYFKGKKNVRLILDHSTQLSIGTYNELFTCLDFFSLKTFDLGNKGKIGEPCVLDGRHFSSLSQGFLVCSQLERLTLPFVDPEKKPIWEAFKNCLRNLPSSLEHLDLRSLPLTQELIELLTPKIEVMQLQSFSINISHLGLLLLPQKHLETFLATLRVEKLRELIFSGTTVTTEFLEALNALATLAKQLKVIRFHLLSSISADLIESSSLEKVRPLLIFPKEMESQTKKDELLPARFFGLQKV